LSTVFDSVVRFVSGRWNDGDMAEQAARIGAGEALTAMERLLDRVEVDRSSVAAATRLEWVRTARRVSDRLQALTTLLVAEADRARASERSTGTPMESWLGLGENLSRREAASVVHQARSLGGHQAVGEAAVAGRIGTGQARAISKVLDSLAPELDAAQQASAEQVLVKLARQLDADALSKSAGRVLEQVVPDGAGDVQERRLQREVERAHRQRSFRFFPEGAAIRFDGSLPRLEGERFMALIDSHSEALRRTAVEARDPLAQPLTPQQRRADALMALLRAAESGREAGGGPGARVLVKLDYDKLRAQAVGAGRIGEGEDLSAGELRRLCCDAGLIPLVLGTRSEVLDVGKESRLVTPAIRAALIQRDGGCVFPGCDVPAARCEAHHLLPWWAGGPTALWNLVLLCPHHHGVVEPARFGGRDQWQVRIDSDGRPEFVAPRRLGLNGTALRHERHGGPRNPLRALRSGSVTAVTTADSPEVPDGREQSQRVGGAEAPPDPRTSMDWAEPDRTPPKRGALARDRARAAPSTGVQETPERMAPDRAPPGTSTR
jgi:hypothetical protein